VTRTGRRLAGPAYLGLFVSLLVGYGLAISHGQWMFGPPVVQLMLSCFVLTIPLFFAGIIFSSLIGEAKDQHLNGVFLQSDGRVVWWA